MDKQHSYKLTIKWTGNTGQGTETYRSYERSYSILGEGKVEIAGSSDPHFRGDKTRYNPEDLLVASLSSCHMLTYLHLCAEAGVTVLAYYDHATGTMAENAQGGGKFSEVMLNPVVTVSDDKMVQTANSLHKQANELCFISNSVNFKVSHNAVCKAADIL
jgi:organic hydroperoxide reductase OsmC/OhrA